MKLCELIKDEYPEEKIRKRVADHPEELNQVHGLSRTPLLWAIRHNQPHVVKLLLDAGALVTSQDHMGKNCIHLAAEYSAPCLEVLINQLDSQVLDVLLVQLTNEEESPLHRASVSEQPSLGLILQLLLEKQCVDEVINNSDKQGKTAVWRAAEHGNVSNCQILLAAGAEVGASIGYTEVAENKSEGGHALEYMQIYRRLKRVNDEQSLAELATLNLCASIRWCLPELVQHWLEAGGDFTTAAEAGNRATHVIGEDNQNFCTPQTKSTIEKILQNAIDMSNSREVLPGSSCPTHKRQVEAMSAQNTENSPRVARTKEDINKMLTKHFQADDSNSGGRVRKLLKDQSEVIHIIKSFVPNFYKEIRGIYDDQCHDQIVVELKRAGSDISDVIDSHLRNSINVRYTYVTEELDTELMMEGDDIVQALPQSPKPHVSPEVLEFKYFARGSPLSCSGEFDDYGTLGCFVYDSVGQRPMFLTCGHVILQSKVIPKECVVDKRRVSIKSCRRSDSELVASRRSDSELVASEVWLTDGVEESFIIFGDYDFKKVSCEPYVSEHCLIDVAAVPLKPGKSRCQCYFPLFGHNNCTCTVSYLPLPGMTVEKTSARTGTTKGILQTLQYVATHRNKDLDVMVNKGRRVSSVDGVEFGGKGDSGAVVVEVTSSCTKTSVAGIYWGAHQYPNDTHKSHLVMDMQMAFAALKKEFGLHLYMYEKSNHLSRNFEEGMEILPQAPKNNLICCHQCCENLPPKTET